MVDAESQERRDQQIADLEGQLEHQAVKVDQYQRQLSALQSSFDRVTRALGCKTPEELENLVLGDRTVWNRRNIEWNAKRTPGLKEEMKAAKDRVAGLELESEERTKRLKERDEVVALLQTQLMQAQAERDTATANLTAARSALASANEQCDEAYNEITAIRKSHDNMKTKHLGLQARIKEERAWRQKEVKRLSKAAKKGDGALLFVSKKMVLAYEGHYGLVDTDNEVKPELTDSDGMLLSPVAKGKGKETRISNVLVGNSSPVSTPTIFGTSSAPNTPAKPRRTSASGVPSHVFPTAAYVYGAGPSSRPAAAISSAAEASDIPPSSYTSSDQSSRAVPPRRSPRKLTPQKRKRPTNENEDGEEDKDAAPSSPRSDVSATQNETQAPPRGFTPTKRARRTAELPTSLPRPLNALALSTRHGSSSSTTPVGRGVRLAPESLPPPPRAIDDLGRPLLPTRPATSPRRTANTKRTSLLSLGSPGKAMVSPKILRTYSKQLRRTGPRERDTTFEEKKARKRGRYSAPEPSTSKVPLDGTDDTEGEETDDEGPKRIFKYQEVVLGNRRKELDAEDCEECREYYEAVGPMPPRLQAPLWRSPTSSPQHQRHVHYHHHHRTEPASAAASGRRGNGKVETTRTRNDEDYDAELDAAYFAHQDETRRGKQVDDHKQQISRHRAVFARPKTPPGFWDIGFPDTPKVDKLNKEAYEMHMKKEATDKKR